MAVEFVGDYNTLGLLLLAIASLAAGFISGLGGAGGPIVMTVFLLGLEMQPTLVAGTSSSIFVMGSMAGGLAYIYSGDVDWKIVLVMAPSLVVGTQIGTAVNPYLSTKLFAAVLAVLMVILGVNIIYRETRGLTPWFNVDVDTTRGKLVLSTLAVLTGVFGGATGFGGGGIIIPALMILGIPALPAVGSGIVQGIIVTTTTSSSYILNGSVDFTLVAISGIPFVVMMLTGWRVAHYINETKLKVTVGLVLLILAPTLIVLA